MRAAPDGGRRARLVALPAAGARVELDQVARREVLAASGSRSAPGRIRRAHVAQPLGVDGLVARDRGGPARCAAPLVNGIAATKASATTPCTHHSHEAARRRRRSRTSRLAAAPARATSRTAPSARSRRLLQRRAAPSSRKPVTRQEEQRPEEHPVAGGVAPVESAAYCRRAGADDRATDARGSRARRPGRIRRRRGTASSRGRTRRARSRCRVAGRRGRRPPG